MVRAASSLAIASIFLLGCGGSRTSATAVSQNPTGGGGRISDYVGEYSGQYYTVPDGTFDSAGRYTPGAVSTMEGTVRLTVSEDGKVAGTRHIVSSGSDQSLVGVIDSEGRLDLMRPGTSVKGMAGLSGLLAKESDGSAVVTLVEDQDASEVQTWRYYRLSGGTRMASRPPLTNGEWLPTFGVNALRYKGTWHRPESNASGALSLVVQSSGRASGTWTDGNGTPLKISGDLQDLAGMAEGKGFAGTLTLGVAHYQARLMVPSVGLTMFGNLDLVGTLSSPEGTGDAAVRLRLIP